MAFRFIQKRMASTSTLQEWYYKLSGFNKYGLMRDDLLNEDFDDDVMEALKRLPAHVIDERNFRILRASQLSITQNILPKEQWTKLEDDKLYLSPIVKQVAKEREEQEDWIKNH